MTDYIWVVELALKPGRHGDFRELMIGMVDAIEKEEPGTINYELFFDEERGVAHIYEQYRDGEAFKTHLENFNRQFSEQFGRVVEVTRFTAYGDPSSEIREILAGFGAKVMPPFLGFAREHQRS